MRASIIQLKDLVFERVRVESEKPAGQASPADAVAFDFNNVKFDVELERGSSAPENDVPHDRLFVIKLTLRIENQEGKRAPYKVDISALGLVELSEKVEKQTRIELATVNGASLIYGAIRDVVLLLTSRSIAGPMMLPTVDFRDHIGEGASSHQEEGRAARKRKSKAKV